jgi:hypothetical protein
MTREEALKKVLEKYKISMPLNPAVRKYIMKSRRRVLINIFKHYGQYNTVIAAALVVYYPLRKIGIAANLIQSAVIMFTLSAVTIISLLTGGYFAVKKFMFSVPVKKQITEEKINRIDEKPTIKKEIIMNKFDNKLIFSGFKSVSADKTIVNQLNAEILKELYFIRGQGNVFKSPAEANGIHIISSLEILESKPELKYILTVKAVNMESGLILIIKEDEASIHDLTAKSISLIKEIIKTIK